MLLSLVSLSITILFTFMVLSFVEKISTMRKKRKSNIGLEQQVQPTMIAINE
ncbi:hypothetical protein [Aquibacillus rhizosphaerae]|uniref:Uncharacterized protein n=1 Tax=Aquibacillus rhizosphaerae TaxID=3051431 RepID=A0ABT7L5P5_9BACI|nr:hypothetical protein [Aquibacillus sp. LR5S19]MDL4841186.1 hypothetical protein [Aquibacillus sp. LR5S19]